MMKEYKDNNLVFINTAGISLVEFFWGLGLPLVIESTFLQLFLKELGASSFMIGFVPGIMFTGQAFFGIVSAYRTKNQARKRAAVILYHLYPAAAILLFGIFLILSGGFHPSTILIFFLSYAVFSFGVGMILPVWQNYVVKLFPSDKVLPAISIMMIVQSAGRLISSFLIAGFFLNKAITPSNSAILFIFCGMLFIVGTFGFLITREKDDPLEEEERTIRFIPYIIRSFKNIFANKNLLLFLLSDIEHYSVITVISFYANYAVTYHNIQAAAAAGLFVGLNYAGQITANLIIGTLNLFSMKTKCIVGRMCSISAVTLLITSSGLPVFLAASVLLGFSKAIRSLIYPAAVKSITGKSDVSSHFAAASILLLPLSTGIPLLSGRMIDILMFLGGDAYRLVFGFMGLISALTILFIVRINFNRTASA